jgi:hypothetical protein
LIGKRSTVDIAGGTLDDLIMHIISQHPLQAGEILLDDTGQLDTAIQVKINSEEIIPHHELSRRTLKREDTVTFMLLFGGG